MTTTDKIEIELPFAGFYESWHDERIDRAVRDAFTDPETGDPDSISDEAADAIYSANVDWSATRVEYCREYVAAFASEFELALEYSGLQSPKFYNFSTDRVFATVDREEFNSKVRKVVEAYPEWPEYIRERFTSQSGFWSNYSNDANSPEWTAEALDQCQYGVMLQAYIDHRATEDPNNVHEWNELEYELMEDIEPWEFDSVNAAIDTIHAYITKHCH